MARIDRIKRQIILKTMSNETWMKKNPDEGGSDSGGVFGQGLLGRRLLRQTESRRRLIVERLFDLFLRDSTKD